MTATTEDTACSPDPSNCDRCGASLERGWSERWCDNRRVEAVCFDCNDAENLRDYRATGVLTSSFMARATIKNVRREYGKGVVDSVASEAYARAWAATEAIQRAAKEFECVVWFGGFAEHVHAAKHRGWRAAFEIAGEQHKVLAWSCAGRVVFTVEPDDESRQISVICAENANESTMGIQGICATEQQAIAMLHGATVAWSRGMRFERDDKVGIL